MKFILETLIWLVLTGACAVWLWGPTWSSLGVSLAISLFLSLIGGNLFFNRTPKS